MLWSYMLAAVGILGIYLAGRRNIWGRVVGFVAQVLWIMYALATDQPGFIVSAVAYAVVYGRNWHRWRTEHRTALAVTEPEQSRPRRVAARSGAPVCPSGVPTPARTGPAVAGHNP